MAKKILTGLGILAAVVGIGVLIGSLAGKGPATVKVNTPAEVSEPPVTKPSSAQPPTIRTQRPQPTLLAATNPPPIHPTLPVAEIAAGTNPTSNTNWEAKLDEILASDEEDTNKVKQLFAIFPSLPPDGQEEFANHLSNLVEDEDYAPLGQLLMDTKLPEDVLDVLLSDLLNRPNATKLPLFLDIAFAPNHPKAAEARDLLELYLDEDYGNDKTAWQKKMQEWLKENPD